MRLRLAVLGTLGALVTVVAAAFVVVPDTLLGVPAVAATVEGLAGLEPTTVMLAASAVAGLYVAVASRTGSGSATDASPADERFAAAAGDSPPEAVMADRRRQTAAGLDATLAEGIEAGGDALTATRETLFATAVDTYAEARAVPREAAREAVERGTWTDSPEAARFLAGDRGPEPGLLARIRLWLTPERERRRRVEATVAAIERVSAAGEGRS